MTSNRLVKNAESAPRPSRSLDLDDYVRRIVEEAPPLTDDQVAYLSTLFHPSPHGSLRTRLSMDGDDSDLAA